MECGIRYNLTDFYTQITFLGLNSSAIIYVHINTSLKMLVTLLVSFKRVLSNSPYDTRLHTPMCVSVLDYFQEKIRVEAKRCLPTT